MKNFRLIALLLVTLFSLSLTSCKDDDDGEDISPKTALLTEAEWTGEGIYVNTPFGTLPLATLLQQMDMGDMADLFDISSTKFKFEKDGTFTGTSDGVIDSGKWKFTDNEQKIVITDADNQETTFTILTLNETNLNLELNITELDVLDPSDLEDIPFQKLELRFVRQ